MGRPVLLGIRSLSRSTEIVCFIDADHSDHGEQLNLLLDPIINDGYDFVVGSRALGNREPGAMTPQAHYGNKLACFLMKLFWGHKYTRLGTISSHYIRCFESPKHAGY